MRTRHLLVAAAVGVAALIPASAHAATLRIVSNGVNIVGDTATEVASATSYVDSTGKRHTLKADTAMGQIVTTGLPYTAVYDASYKAAYLTRLAGVKATATGYWSFLVNGSPSAVGATDATLKATDEVVWVLDSDYSSKNGPYAYELDSTKNADGTVTFTAMKIGGPKPVVAGGAVLLVNGTKVGNLDENGTLTLTPTGPWTAQIAAKKKIAPSEKLSG